MTNDTILIRIDIDTLCETLRDRENIPENLEPILDRMMAAFQYKIEEQAQDFARGNGEFETCLFEAL